MTLDVERVPADEEVLVGLEAVHRVAGADPGQPLVGLDEDERRLEPTARHRIPGCREGRVELERDPAQANGGDLHDPGRKNAFQGGPASSRVSSCGSPAAPASSASRVASAFHS